MIRSQAIDSAPICYCLSPSRFIDVHLTSQAKSIIVVWVQCQNRFDVFDTVLRLATVIQCLLERFV